MKHNKHATTLAALLIVAVALSPMALAQSGGGTVQNQTPSITSGLSGTVSSTNNLAAVPETFSFTVQDSNGEADILGVKIVSTEGSFGTRQCIAPFTGCSGWTKTDTTPGDGILAFSYEHTWPAGQAPGTFTQTVSVKDEGSYVAGATTDQTTFSNAANVSPSAGTYASDGTSDGAAWGGWSAEPGASLVQSTNYLKASNPGTASGPVTVSFSDTVFLSPSTGGSIDVDGNIKFLYGTGSSPSTTTFASTATDADGSYTFSVPPGETLWIGYEMQAFPGVLADASDYAASYTFG